MKKLHKRYHLVLSLSILLQVKGNLFSRVHHLKNPAGDLLNEENRNIKVDEIKKKSIIFSFTNQSSIILYTYVHIFN